MSMNSLPGQHRAKRFLLQLYRRELIPHALLFSGLAGVGKKALAHQFAKLLNCRNPQENDCCDHCDACRKTDANVHPDVILIQREGAFIKISQIRELRNHLKFAPFEGIRRVIILEDAHRLNEEASNALLKILEEPPRNHVFILITPNPQMLLPTLLSRCCHVRFQPLESRLILQELFEGEGLEPSSAQKAARLSLGSRDRAQGLSRGTLSRWQELTAGLIKLPALSVSETFQFVSHWLKNTEDLEEDLQCIKFWMRDMVFSILLAGHDPVFELDAETLRALDQSPVEALFEFYDDVESAAHHLTLNANKQLIVEGLCLSIRNILYGKGHRNSISQVRQDLPL